ncbi:MAG: hypothetical protein ACRCYS_17850, partial [Beijerinckiaceae bacterium]
MGPAAIPDRPDRAVGTSALIIFIFTILGPFFGANFVTYFFVVPESETPLKDLIFIPLIALQAWPVAMLFGGVQAF